MTWTLIIWTVVAMAGDRHYQAREYSWKPLTEFHDSTYPPQLAQEKCEMAAKQLGLKEYRCIRTK
jgi:hypothetical protein